MSDEIFFLVEFTDTSLVLNKVADSLQNSLSELNISILKVLIEEVDQWLVGIFVNKSAKNIFEGANSVNSAAKQFISFIGEG